MQFTIEALDSGAWRLLCERCAPSPITKADASYEVANRIYRTATPAQLAALCGMESARCDVCKVSEDEGDD